MESVISVSAGSSQLEYHFTSFILLHDLHQGVCEPQLHTNTKATVLLCLF